MTSTRIPFSASVGALARLLWVAGWVGVVASVRAVRR